MFLEVRYAYVLMYIILILPFNYEVAINFSSNLLCVVIGKMTRGLMVVSTVAQIYGNRPLTAEEKRLAFTLGWCIEIVSQ